MLGHKVKEGDSPTYIKLSTKRLLGKLFCRVSLVLCENESKQQPFQQPTINISLIAFRFCSTVNQGRCRYYITICANYKMLLLQQEETVFQKVFPKSESIILLLQYLIIFLTNNVIIAFNIIFSFFISFWQNINVFQTKMYEC